LSALNVFGGMFALGVVVIAIDTIVTLVERRSPVWRTAP